MDNKITLINQAMALKSVVFLRKDNQKGTFKVIVSDKIKDLIINDDGISFNYLRHVSLEPEALFDIVVEFEYIAKFDLQSLSVIKEKEYALDDGQMQSIVNNTVMPQTASMIISNLTVTNGGNPLITQPNFVK